MTKTYRQLDLSYMLAGCNLSRGLVKNNLGVLHANINKLSCPAGRAATSSHLAHMYCECALTCSVEKLT